MTAFYSLGFVSYQICVLRNKSSAKSVVKTELVFEFSAVCDRPYCKVVACELLG